MSAPFIIYMAREEAYQRIVAECELSPGYETGGILVGRMFRLPQGLCLVIVSASGPGKRADRQTHTYAPDVDEDQQELERIRQLYSEYRVDYVGVWHKHPAGFNRPSSGDTNQVQGIFQDQGYVLPDGIYTPIVTIENGIFSLHSYYYPRETCIPVLVNHEVCENNIRELLDSLVEFEQTSKPLEAKNRWGVSLYSLRQVQQRIVSDLAIHTSEAEEEIIYLDNEVVVIKSAREQESASRITTNETHQQHNNDVVSVPFNHIPPSLPTHIDQELIELERYCKRIKAIILQKQPSYAYEFEYLISLASPLLVDKEVFQVQQSRQTKEGEVKISLQATEEPMAVTEIAIIGSKGFPERAPQISIHMTDGSQLSVLLDRLFPNGWSSNIRLYQVVDSLIQQLERVNNVSFWNFLELPGRLIIRSCEVLFRSAADICADLNRNYVFPRRENRPFHNEE